MATGSLPLRASGLAECELSEEEIEAVKAELPETDGEPLESPWHRAAINLLIDVVIWHRRGQTDYFVGGNMFIYYSRSQARNREYKGPDFFYVKDVDGTRERLFWWVFDEDDRFPNMIMELLSPTTAQVDRTTKKSLYEKRFQTPEYFSYDPETQVLEGWRLREQKYEAIRPNEKGWLWSEEFGLWVGTWQGVYMGRDAIWVRFYDSQGNLLLTEAEAQRQLAEQEKQRADTLAAQVAQLQALLNAKGLAPDQLEKP